MSKGVQQLILAGRVPQGLDANAVLNLHFDGANGSTTLIDSSGFSPPNIITATGNTSISTAQAKFGPSSFLNTGQNGSFFYASPGTNFDFGSGNFTIDFWIRITSSASIYIVSRTTSYSYFIYLNGTVFNISFSSTGTSFDMGTLNSTIGLTLNVWHHVALVRNGNIFTIYIDGVSAGTLTSSLVLHAGGTYLLFSGEGSFNLSSGGVSTYYDEFRVSNIARWTAPFTPPAAPYS